jgi:hypothetical protein
MVYRITWRQTSILVIILCSLCLTATEAEARYRPRNRRPPRGSITTTAARTGCQPDIGCLQALAPLKHVGQSQLAQPTIAWLVPSHQSHCPTVLSWYSLNNQKQPILQTELKTQAGMNYWRMPSSQPLKPGEYVWKTELDCNSGSPANNPFVGAEIDILAPTAQADPSELWYDQFARAIDQPEQIQLLLQDLVSVEAMIPDPSSQP